MKGQINRRKFLEYIGIVGTELALGGCASFSGLPGRSGPVGRWLDYDGVDLTKYDDGGCDIQINGHTDGYACSLVVRDATEGVANDFMKRFNKTQFFTVDKPKKGYMVATLQGREFVAPLKYIRTNKGVEVYELGDIDLVRPFIASQVEDEIKGRVAGIKTSVGKAHNEAVEKETQRLKALHPGEVADPVQ